VPSGAARAIAEENYWPPSFTKTNLATKRADKRVMRDRRRLPSRQRTYIRLYHGTARCCVVSTARSTGFKLKLPAIYYRRHFHHGGSRAMRYGGNRSPAAAPAPRAATPPRRQASLRIFVVRGGLPCDPPVGGHPCHGGMIPRLHRAVSDKNRASEERFGCKIGKVRREHIESLYPPAATDLCAVIRPVLVPIRKVSNQKFQYFRPSSSWCSFSFASCRRLPSRLNDQQTCYRRASQFSKIIFAIVCVEH
jgi:hypothetical protein